MAARTLKPRHQDDVRAKIQTSQLLNKLQNHALSNDESEISASRMKAIEILLKKSLPDLTATDLNVSGSLAGMPAITIAKYDDDKPN